MASRLTGFSAINTQQISYKRPRKGPSPRKGPAKRLGRSAEEVPRPRKGWEEAQKPQKAQKPELEKAQKGRPRKGCEGPEKAGVGKRPRSPQKAQKRLEDLGRGPEAHKRPRRGHKSHCFEQVFQAGLQAIVLSKFGASFSGRLASHCFEQVLSKFFRQACKKAEKAPVLSKIQKKKLGQNSVKTLDLNPIQFL